MDAHALLSAQGWRGTGHSLHKTDDSVGLAKPILVSRKNNTHGLGQKQHFTSDQWWMNAFDEQLKGLDTSKEGSVVQTVTTGKLNTFDTSLGKWSVYTTFVRGGFLEGTIKKVLDASSSTSTTDSDEADQDTSKTSDPKTPKETKEERRARKEAKRKRKEERAQGKAARKERKERKAKSKNSSSSAESTDADEEKRRRRARKEEKRRKRQEGIAK